MLTLVLVAVVGVPAVTLLILKVWLQLTVIKCNTNVSMKGKTVLVTGASAGRFHSHSFIVCDVSIMI